MNIRCAFGWHRWKELWRFVTLRDWGPYKLTGNILAGRICADCRKRERL